MIHRFAAWNARKHQNVAKRWERRPTLMSALFLLGVGGQIYAVYQRAQFRKAYLRLQSEVVALRDVLAMQGIKVDEAELSVRQAIAHFLRTGKPPLFGPPIFEPVGEEPFDLQGDRY